MNTSARALRWAVMAAAMLALAGCGGKAKPAGEGVPAEDLATVSGELALDESTPDVRLFVYQLGDVKPDGARRLRCGGYDLLLVHRATNKTVFRCGSSEADYDELVDYFDLSLGVLRVTQLTRDPRKPGEDVPLVETAVRVLKDGACEIKEHLLLDAEVADAATVTKWRDAAIRAIGRREGADLDAYADALEHLRNIAIATPEPVAAAYDAIRPLTDGHTGCLYSQYRAEVDRIAEIRGREKR